MKYKINIPEYLKNTRGALGLTQEQLAEICETTRNKITRIETASVGVDFREVQNIINITKLFCDFLENEQIQLTEKQREIFVKIKSSIIEDSNNN